MKAWGIFVLLVSFCALPAAGDTITLNPVDDGSLYTCSTCSPNPFRSYVEVSGNIVGDIDFSTAAFQGKVGTALLSVNPYGLPLWGLQLDVYGYANSSATISMSDLASPTFIGVWNIPATLKYGQDTFFDVTNFLGTVNTPYVNFILKDAYGTDIFSSTEYNYGHPSQLTVTTVPEPSSLAMLLGGFGIASGLWRRRLFTHN